MADVVQGLHGDRRVERSTVRHTDRFGTAHVPFDKIDAVLAGREPHPRLLQHHRREVDAGERDVGEALEDALGDDPRAHADVHDARRRKADEQVDQQVELPAARAVRELRGVPALGDSRIAEVTHRRRNANPGA
jgi:hypothetical protein